MIAVIFELQPAAGAGQRYFEIAGQLAPLLAEIDGFISVERFRSLGDPDKFLSLSFWRDEDAVRAWRNRVEHRQGQRQGRGGVLGGYRLRVAAVLRDYGMDDRVQAPADSRAALSGRG